MPESAISIANYFIKKSLDTGVEVTPLKLIKLVYLAHGWYLGYTNQPLVAEAVEAWQYGPVVPRVYHAVKDYGKEKINSMVQSCESFEVNYPLPIDPNVPVFLDTVWSAYAKHSGLELSALTHQNGTPWHKTWDTSKGKIIPNDLIRDFYREKINAAPSTN